VRIDLNIVICARVLICFNKVCIASYVVLRLYEPPSVRLLEGPRPQAQAAPPQSKSSTTGFRQRFGTPSFSGTLSSSDKSREGTPYIYDVPRATLSQPPTRASSAVFGQPSLVPHNWGGSTVTNPQASYTPDVDMDARTGEDEDAMDWTPTISSPAGDPTDSRTKKQKIARNSLSQSLLEDSGLDSLFSQTSLTEEPVKTVVVHRLSIWSWGQLCVLLVIATLPACYAVWLSVK
jgi:hypothetical protein